MLVGLAVGGGVAAGVGVGVGMVATTATLPISLPLAPQPQRPEINTSPVIEPAWLRMLAIPALLSLRSTTE